MTIVKEFKATQTTATLFTLTWLTHPDAIHYYIFYGQSIDMQGWYKASSPSNPFMLSGAIRVNPSTSYTIDFDAGGAVAWFGGTNYYSDKINPGGILYFGIRAQNSNGELSEMSISKVVDIL